MATPESRRKTQVLFEIAASETGVRAAATISQVTSRTTVVLMAVARLELIPSTPTLARMAVAPAKSAESSDQKSQLFRAAPMACEGGAYWVPAPAPEAWAATCFMRGPNCEAQRPLSLCLLSNPASPASLTVETLGLIR